jgi:hypothetical protein
MVSKVPSQSVRRLFAELFVIVAGVLIALAIDEWRKEVENANIEHEYIQQLIVDLRATEDLVTRSEPTNTTGGDAASRLVAAFQAEENIESGQVIDLILALPVFDNPVPVLGTAEALVATGDLRLIRDSSARSAITQYLSYTRGYLLTPVYDIENRYRDYLDQISALAAANGITPLGGANSPRKNTEPNVGAFFANNQAYVVASKIVRLRRSFTWYRAELAITARELREQLEKL